MTSPRTRSLHPSLHTRPWVHPQREEKSTIAFTAGLNLQRSQINKNVKNDCHFRKNIALRWLLFEA